MTKLKEVTACLEFHDLTFVLLPLALHFKLSIQLSA